MRYARLRQLARRGVNVLSELHACNARHLRCRRSKMLAWLKRAVNLRRACTARKRGLGVIGTVKRGDSRGDSARHRRQPRRASLNALGAAMVLAADDGRFASEWPLDDCSADPAPC